MDLQSSISEVTSLPQDRQSIKQRLISYFPWTQKVGFAIADQAAFAGSNFIINIVLARWMTSEAYGAFAIAYAWFLLLLSAYDGLVVEPMALYGAGKYSKKFRQYLGYLLYGHVVVTIAISLILGVAGVLVYFLNSQIVAVALLGAAVAAPFFLSRWFIRQPFYVLMTPHWSVIGGVIYSLVALTTLTLFHSMEVLNSFTALVGMGFAGLISSTIMMVFVLKPQLGHREGITAKEVLKDHLRYGKWSISARSLSWLSSNSGYVIVPMILGVGAAGTLSAVGYLVMPIFMMNQAIIGLLVPTFVRTYQGSGGRAALDQRVRRIVIMSMAFTGIYCSIVILFGKSLVHLLYDGKYDSAITTTFLIAMALLPVITTGSSIYSAALAAMGKNKLTFKAKIIPTFLTVILDLSLVSIFGLVGYYFESLITASLTQILLRMNYAHSNKPTEKDGAILAQPKMVPAEVASD